MAAEKKTTKKTVKKATVKKASAKPAAPKAAEPKVEIRKAPAPKAPASKAVVSHEKFYSMVSEAAYFAAQNDRNRKGSVEYWIEAEAALRAKYDIA
ncbi:MAG TPA: hypothetical protein PLD51_08230 [Pontiellaceae bacterium]|nr:hypothetical protein [Pontiellaceae bacterium]